MRFYMNYTIPLKQRKMATALGQNVRGMAFMLWRTVMKRSYWQDVITKKRPQDQNQPPHTETSRRQEATSQRSDSSIHAECQPFFSRDWMCYRGSQPSPQLPGITSCPGVFVAACKVYFLSNCKQTIGKISIESARLRETPAGTEACGWIIHDDFVVLLLVCEVCVCVCDMYLWIQLGKKWPSGDLSSRSQDTNTPVRACLVICQVPIKIIFSPSRHERTRLAIFQFWQ